MTNPVLPVYLQSHAFLQTYGAILPTSLTYVVLSARGCSPWRPDAVIGTTDDGLDTRPGVSSRSAPFGFHGSSAVSLDPSRVRWIIPDFRLGLELISSLQSSYRFWIRVIPDTGKPDDRRGRSSRNNTLPSPDTPIPGPRSSIIDPRSPPGSLNRFRGKEISSRVYG